MKTLFTIFFMLTHQLSFSQNIVETDTALNTCTVIFFSRFHPEQRSIRFDKYPVFINDSLVGKVGQNRYLVVKTTPGKKIIAPQMDGKKLRKRARRIEVMMEAGDTRYYEIIDPVPPFSFYLTLFEASGKFGQEQVQRMKKIVSTENCNLAKPGKKDPFENKRFFIRVPLGYNIPSDNYKSWWPAELRPVVNRFQPFMFGFETGVKAGKKNHFLSWEYANSRQSPVAAAISSQEKKYISINTNTLYYAYAFPLDVQNKYLLYPKIGYSFLNYILESQSGNSGGFKGVGGSGICGGLYFEYRISRVFSVDASWSYLNGTITFENKRINLNQQRLFAGLRVQF